MSAQIAPRILNVATRQSALAMWQTNWVCDQIIKKYPDWKINIIGMTTEGDQHTDKPLYEIGGKALFVNALEKVLLNKEADIAIHSMKDVPAILEGPFNIACVLKREDPADAFICNSNSSLDQLRKGAVVGSSSVRRCAQLLHHRPDIIIKSLRGNVPTRLKKLDNGDYDAIILALSGLKRLGLAQRATEIFPFDILLPAASQGAIGIECLAENAPLIDALSALSDKHSSACITAERAMVATLNGNCTSPIGALAMIDHNIMSLTGCVADQQGRQVLKVTESSTMDMALTLGQSVAKALLAKGAKELL